MHYPLLKAAFYLALLRDVVDFIKHPSNVRDKEKPFKQKIYESLGLYLLKFIFLIPVILFFALVYDPKNIQEVSMFERFSPLMLLLLSSVILPLAEEVCFRLSLIFKPIYLALSSSVLVYYVLTKLVFHTKISMVDDSFAIRIIAAVVTGLILYPIYRRTSVKIYLTGFWQRHFRSIYYVTCISFAWIHIVKYDITWLNLLLMPILTLPQLYSAILYGYIRVRFGFAYPLVMHGCMNFLAMSLALLGAGSD